MHQENYKRSIDRSQGTQLMSEGSAYKKLFSVKEVCEMTGLNRKKLFDYQDMVPPSDYDKSGYRTIKGRNNSLKIFQEFIANHPGL